MNTTRRKVTQVLAKKADVQVVQFGILGDASGTVEVNGRPNYVYAIVNDQLVQVYNQRAPAIPGLPVMVGYEPTQPGLLQVLAIWTIERYGNSDISSQIRSTPHHGTHEWQNVDGGNDVVYVQLRQMMPLRPTPVGDFNLHIDRDVQLIGGTTWMIVGGTVLDLSDYHPYSDYNKERFVLISLDLDDGGLVITQGSLVTLGTIALSNIPATPDGHKPICAVRLYFGQTEIIEARTQTDIVDMRWAMVGVVPTITLHASTHQNGGADELNVAGLSGLLADPQTPLAHKTSHQNDGADELSVAGLSGLLADPQTPAVHASTHQNGGADELSVAGLSGLLADPQTPLAHTHDELHEHAINEDKTAECDGSKTTFILANEFRAESSQVYQNGLRLRLGVDYTEGAYYDTIEMASAPSGSAILIIDTEVT